MHTVSLMCVGTCMKTCEHVSGYTSILIYIHTAYMCVRAGESVSMRVLCFSVCQFHRALYD